MDTFIEVVGFLFHLAVISILYILYYFAPPYILYRFSWQKPRLKKYHSALLAIFAGYIIGNISPSIYPLDLEKDYNLFEIPTQVDFMLSIGNYGNHIFWLYAGWIPVTIYVLICWWVLNILRKRNIL